jgi:hypothetical protein
MNRREFNLDVTRTLPLALGLGSSALDAAVAAGDEKRLVVIPLLWSREVFVVPPERPHCFVRHLNLEGFTCANRKTVPGAEQGVWVTDHIWEWREDGTFACTGTVVEGAGFALELKPEQDFLDMRVTIRIQGTRTLEDLSGTMCLDIRRNTLMYDPSMKRTFVEVGGGPVPMSQTDVAGSLGGVMPTYFLKGTPPERRWISEGARAYGWSISKTEIDSPLVAVTSQDGAWTTGEWFWPCSRVTGNYKKPYHGCIHSEPAFGTLAPGGSATVVGRLYLMRGSLGTVWSRMAADFRRMQKQAQPPI